MKRLLFLFLCVLLTCTGCKKETPELPAGPETTALEATIAQTEIPQTTESAAIYVDEEDANDTALYSSVLETYRQALTENWNQAQCSDANISILTAYCTQGENSLHNLCFAFHDLDGGGDKELLIAPTVNDGFVDKMVFAMYDLVDGAPRQLFSGFDRIRYYLCYGDNGECWIANEGSGGAAASCWFYYRYDGTDLVTEKSVIFDADTSPEAPWFIGTDDSWDLTTKKSVDEATALELIGSFDEIKVNIHRGFSRQQTFADLE